MFDRSALEEQIRATNEQIALRQLEKERKRNEEWLLRERNEAIEGALMRRQVADRARLLRLGYVVLKAFWRRSVGKKRNALNSENQVKRGQRKTLR